MSRMKEKFIAEMEANGGTHPSEIVDDSDAPGRVVSCDCCDQPGTEENPIVFSVMYGIETWHHAGVCFEGRSYKPGHDSDIPF